MSREEDQLEQERDDEQTFADAEPRSDAAGETGDPSSLDSQDDAASLELSDDAEDFARAEDDDDDNDDDDEEDVVIHDADAEDAAEKLAEMRREMSKMSDGGGDSYGDSEIAPGGSRSMSELISIIESLIFVSEEPLPTKTLAEVLKEDRGWVQVAVEELAKEFNERNGGLMLREVAGGWQFATRPENHEHVRAFLKSRPSAKLSLAALETLAVIAYKQPITVPEILEIRGVQSSSAIKTLLDKRLIVSKGRKETVGRPMMYGTSKEFLLQFGLRDLSELPNVEDFEDLATGGA
ncbi:MAG TPA: SMC-Scp complex subunit ScpB [Pyrinomonadaceae bacterium]|jgi:segregation and condensation protein B|nr:SMC-Scp complex subunit ScpB [Pyrinomonadaceae bacterium]